MNQGSFLIRVRSSKYYLACLILVSFTIPLPVIYNNVALGLLIFYWIIAGQIRSKIVSVFNNKFFWIFAAFYLYQFIGILYSTDVGDALTKIEKKAGLIILPFLLLASPALKLKEIFYVILAFAVSCFAIMAYAIAKINITYGSLFKVQQITETIDDIIHLHHAYSGLYLVFSICSLVYLLLNFWQLFNLVWRVFILTLVFSLYIMLIILGARMALFNSFLILGLQVLVISFQTRNFRAIAFILVTASIGLLGIFSLPSTREKLQELLYYRGVYHPFTPRLIQWQCCFDIVSENKAWLHGVGTGDVKPLLQACYQNKKFWGGRYNYNSHNEYLEELVRHGLIGLTLFLLALIIPFIIATLNRNYLYLYFLLIFMFACLSEAILNRQKGVIFFAFFNALLFLFSSSGKNLLNEKSEVNFSGKQ